MEIQNNGAHIIIEDGELQDAFALVCKCGHKLSEHASPVFWYYPDPHHHTIHSSQCTRWKDKTMKEFCCERFQIK